MFDFGDIKSESFKEASTSMQILHLFHDALRIINQQYCDSKSVSSNKTRVVPQTCEVSKDSFKIILRVYDIGDITFPVFWFVAQSAAYSSIRGDVRYRIDAEFVKDKSSYVELVYRVWIDLPF